MHYHSFLVLVDLSSAFDTLNRRMLSYRLREICILGQVHNLLMSFVSNRISSVNIKSFVHPYIYYHLFADDLHIYTFFLPGSDIDIIQLAIANCVNDLISWFACNSISLNITKKDSITLSRFLSSITLTHYLTSYLKHHHYSRFY